MYWKAFYIILIFTFTIGIPMQSNAMVHQRNIDTIRIPQITIKDHFFPKYTSLLNSGDSSWHYSSLYKDAGMLLNDLTPIFLRNYGPGLIYSISIRGSNSAQTQILWDGIELNNPMHGQSDLSLIKFLGGSKILFHPNSYSGGLSGSIEFKEEMNTSHGFEYKFSEKLSSLFGHDFYGGISMSKNGHVLQIATNINHSKNQYHYEINGERKRIEHADISSYQFKISHAKKWRNNHKLDFKAWISKSDREIPPSIYEASSDAIQKDESIRFMANYQYISTAFQISFKNAWLNENINYTSTLRNIESDAHSGTFINQFNLISHLPAIGLIKLKIQNKWNQVVSSSYYERKSINYLTYDLNWIKEWGTKQSLFAGFRSGFKNTDKDPFSPYIHYRFSPLPYLKAMVSTGIKYRHPSFNDLYWLQGGNDELESEKAIENEISLQIIPVKNQSIELRVFYKLVDNWIMWKPVDGIFYAQNIQKVIGKGIELSLLNQIKMRSLMIQSRIFYNYNLIQEMQDNEIKRQLVYTPTHFIKQNIRLQKGDWNFLLDHNWTGIVYTSTDHSSSLDPFYLLNIKVERQFKFRNQKLLLSFAINNTFNNKYFTIRNYVMPGRHFFIGVGIHGND